MGWGEGGESCLRVAVRLSCGTVCVAVVVWGPVVRKSCVCILSWGGRSSSYGPDQRGWLSSSTTSST